MHRTRVILGDLDNAYLEFKNVVTREGDTTTIIIDPRVVLEKGFRKACKELVKLNDRPTTKKG